MAEINEEEFKQLELKAELAKSYDCIRFKEILLDMIFDYSATNIEPSELKGMVRLLAKTRDWDKRLDKKIKLVKEEMK